MSSTLIKPPCQKCGKPAAIAYGSFLSGVWICRTCVKADLGLQARLTPKARKELKK